MVSLQSLNNHTDYFLSCDWGTSSFRLYLVRVSDGEILDSVTSLTGVKTIFNKAELNYASRKNLFKNTLQDQINLLAERVDVDLHGLSVVISGMISSSIGWKELPYAGLPFALDGSSLITEVIPSGEHFPHQVILISGVSSGEDIMRGEETQLMGLIEKMDNPSGCFILPGTHSKHIFIKDGEIKGFKTFMTGEMFAILSEYSILRASLLPSFPFDDKDFEAGVAKGLEGNLLHELFTIRAKSVIEQEEIFSDYLSGVLIGYEIATLKEEKKIVLCASQELTKQYELAMKSIMPDNRFQVIPQEDMIKSVPLGHLKILNHLLTN